MGTPTSKFEFSHGLRQSLRDIPFQPPTDVDYDFLSYQTGLSKDQVKDILDEHLQSHPNGVMNRREFCTLYHLLRKESPQIVEGLSDNIFRALGVSSEESDFITLNEFLITYALTSRCDTRKKLEYAFNLYDFNRNNALDVDEVKEIIYGMLELFNPHEESKRANAEIARDAFKNLKVSQVVKKDDFINGMVQNKTILSIMSPYE